MPLLRPLVTDVMPGIQQTAILALAHLADHNEELAGAVVKEDILPNLVHTLIQQQTVSTVS